MTVESAIYSALAPLVGNRVFPDVAPITTTKPYITYSQIGGEATGFLENGLPSKKNGRFQVNVWADTRSSSSLVMLQIEAALVAASSIQARPHSAHTNTYDSDMLTYGSMQDFSIWSDR